VTARAGFLFLSFKKVVDAQKEINDKKN
jgi:hypothetical protein